MPKPIRFTYEKRAPFRDAFYFIIICEGENREPDYFRFFDGMSSRVKVVPVESVAGNSSPEKLWANALAAEKELGASEEQDRLWFVLDTDKWQSQIHALREESKKHPHWRIAQSNPCFEVWLYFHAKDKLPELKYIHLCNNWKPHLPKVINGGFNPDFHPVAIETAAANSRNNYQANGYSPQPGSTQVFELAEELLPLIAKDLQELKQRFPAPQLLEE